MKLENYQYSIIAARENGLYRVRAYSEAATHDFRVHTSETLSYVVVISREIAELLEDMLHEDAMQLRGRLTSIFLTHRAAIDFATAGTTDFVKVYAP